MTEEAATRVAPTPAPASTEPPSDPPPTSPTWRVLGAVTAAAVVGALAFPGARVGVGWPLCLVAVAVAALIARAERRATSTPPAGDSAGDRAWRIAAAAGAVVLVSVAGIRAASWLVAICLGAGILVGSYALAGGRSWWALVRGSLALGPATVLAFGWAAQPASGPATAGSPGTGAGKRTGRMVAAVAVGVALLAVFGALFRSADPAFADLTDGWIRNLRPDSPGRIVLGLFAIGTAALATAYLASTRPAAHRMSRPARRQLGPAEWGVPVAMLDLLFGLFVWVQFRVLFAGKEFVLGPGGPDYADYARGGSAQLAVVIALTLAVLAVLSRFARRDSRAELGQVRLLGGLLCGLTLVVAASALTRLALYAGAYGLTPPRLLAFCVVVWLGLVVLLVLVAGVRLRAPWLPRASAAAAVSVLIGLAAINPDALIARTVLDRANGPFPVDYGYLESVSADAVAELEAIPNQARKCRTELSLPELGSPDPWYAFNLSRWHARQVLRDHPILIGSCD